MKGITRLWYKIPAIGIVLYVLVAGLLKDLPTDVGNLGETIRNLFYHVPMWFGMMILLLAAWILSMMHLADKSGSKNYDLMAQALTNTGILMGLCGVLTGMLWAKNTWGDFWTRDPKLNGVAIGLCMYAAHWLMEVSIAERDKKGRLCSIYNILIFPMFIALIYVMPKLAAFSIHPGSGDSVNFKTYNKPGQMESVFYPAVIGWTLLFVWISELVYRVSKINNSKKNEELVAQHIMD